MERHMPSSIEILLGDGVSCTGPHILRFRPSGRAAVKGKGNPDCRPTAEPI
jgi:hypothetical protein